MRFKKVWIVLESRNGNRVLRTSENIHAASGSLPPQKKKKKKKEGKRRRHASFLFFLVLFRSDSGLVPIALRFE
jgi:hypothetical protein